MNEIFSSGSPKSSAESGTYDLSDAAVDELRLREAVGAMQDGIAIYGPTGVLEFCNDSFRLINGYSEAETEFGVATYDQLGKLDARNNVVDHTPLDFAERLALLKSGGANLVVQHHGDRIYERRQSAIPSGGMINLITDITEHHRLEITQKGRNTVLEQLARGHSLQEVLTTMIEHCEGLFPGMLASVLLMDETGTRLLEGAAPSLPQSYREAIHGVEIGQNVGSCGTAAYSKKRVIVSDIAAHPFWSDFCQIALDAGLKACWSQPIFAANGYVLGTFAMYYRETRSPSEEEMRFIGETANVAGIAIEFQRKEMAIKSALEHAQQANKAKSEFLATMSHELRTPLNAILGFSDMLRGSHLGDIEVKSYQEYATDIYQSGQHLLGLINDVLDISAIEAGKRILRKEAIEVEDLLEESFRVFKPQASEASIDLGYEIAPDVDSIFADRRSAKQIILNLVSNAMNYTSEGGTVALSVYRSGDNVIIEVRDTGIGIAPEMLTHITEPFTRGHVNSMLSKKGTGLGLSIVMQLITLHDGTLHIDSDVGVGTTVTVSLPNPDQIEQPADA